MINKSTRLPRDNLYPLLCFAFIISTPTKTMKPIKIITTMPSNLKPNTNQQKHENQSHSWILLLWAMELRSLALRDESEEEVLGIERIPRARRIKITKVNVNGRVSISVDDGDFRVEIREYLAFAIFVKSRNRERDRWEKWQQSNLIFDRLFWSFLFFF